MARTEPAPSAVPSQLERPRPRSPRTRLDHPGPPSSRTRLDHPGPPSSRTRLDHPGHPSNRTRLDRPGTLLAYPGPRSSRTRLDRSGTPLAQPGPRRSRTPLLLTLLDHPGPHSFRTPLLPTLLGLLLLLLSPWPSLAGPARPPLSPGQPFLVFWGIPDTACAAWEREDPGAYGLQPPGRAVLFYEDSLGLYPYYPAEGGPVNGGLPQNTRLDAHLQRLGEDVAAALPQAGWQGLGVVRWERWAPQWRRNPGKQSLYRAESTALLQGFFPDWTTAELESWAQVDFEAAAQSVLTETLRELRRLRPQALWGFALFPECLPDPQLANQTAPCPASEMALNDQLLWLWQRSSALYPSLSLEKDGAPQTRLDTSNQIREALRVAGLAGTASDLPVFPLVRSVYASTNSFLSEVDLANTIGESVAIGTAGVIIWDRTPIQTQRACSELARFVREVLGPYSRNVTGAARLCSASLCQGRGCCVRQNPESSAYLHLAPSDLLLLVDSEGVGAGREGGPAAAEQPDPANLERWKRDFRCRWFAQEGALEGAAADQEAPKDGAALGGQGRGWGQGPASPPPSLKTPSLTELSDDSGSPKPPPADRSAPPLSAAQLPVLLLASALCLAAN